MLGRVKLTTQAAEEYIPPSKKRASVSATASPAKKSKPTREKVHACTHPGCDKSFVRPCRLEEHLRSHTGERPYKCTADPENCDKCFLRESHLKAHIKALHLKEKHLKCTVMIAPGTEGDRGVFGFKRKPSEPSHTPNGNTNENEDGEVLRVCGARFSTNQQLKRHMESHMKTFPHTCTEYPPCSAGFRKRGPLRRHIRSAHLNALPWACRLQDIDDPDKPCTAAFDTRGKLGGHIDMVHKRLLPALYTCAMCIVLETDKKETQQVPEIAGPEGFIGREVEASTDHEEGGDDPANSSPDSTHDFDSAASTPFPIIRSVLVDDSANRPTPDPETAILQGKMGFKTFRELRRHTIEMHPPTCKQCGYTCKNGRNLKIHIKNSHGAGVDERRTFPCQLCDSRFTKKHALKVHVNRVHEQLRPFVCTHAPCTKTYGYKAQLTRHIENHHSGRKPKPKKPRKKTAKLPGLIAQLTGVGYEDSGRNIKCVVEECPYRFFRVYDLSLHLRGANHGFTDGQVDELIVDVKRQEVEEEELTEDETEDDYGSSESESESDNDDEYGVGMKYADLWDSMSDMEIMSDMEVDKNNEL